MVWLGFCNLRDSSAVSSSQTVWEAVPRTILKPTLYSAYDLDFCGKQKLMVYAKKTNCANFCNLMFIALPHYIMLWKAVIRHIKTLIRFETISNKDFYHIDLLCWERLLCQVSRSTVGFSAGFTVGPKCPGLHWVPPDRGKGGGWGAGQQLCSKALGRQQTEQEWAEITPGTTTLRAVVAETATRDFCPPGHIFELHWDHC